MIIVTTLVTVPYFDYLMMNVLSRDQFAQYPLSAQIMPGCEAGNGCSSTAGALLNTDLEPKAVAIQQFVLDDCQTNLTMFHRQDPEVLPE